MKGARTGTAVCVFAYMRKKGSLSRLRFAKKKINVGCAAAGCPSDVQSVGPTQQWLILSGSSALMRGRGTLEVGDGKGGEGERGF